MKPNVFLYFLVTVFTLLHLFSHAQEPAFLTYKTDEWVEEKLKSLNLDEKIAQLMIVTVYPTQNEASKDFMLSTVEQVKPGGILVMQGNPSKTARWINEFQYVSPVPLLVAVDGEWGPAMRIDSTVRYPYSQALGAVLDTNLIYKMGKEFGEQLKMLGINMNFAPDADVNTNPANPVINFRSFGEDKENVAVKAWMVAKGMQDAGIIAVAKHFPGHGDTQSDSHHTLPLINHDKNRLDQIETYPFRYLSEQGIAGIMTAHLNVPALDPSGKTSSLSKKVVTGYLKNEIGFKGFVVTDAINMKGVQAEPGRAEVEALIAGNDMVEFVPDLIQAVNAVKKAIEKNEISEQEINDKCRTVLALKRWVNLNNYLPADLTKLTDRLNAPSYEVTQRKLIKSSLTVLKNNDLLPVQDLEKRKIASITIGDEKQSAFQKMLANYTSVDHFILPKEATEKQWANLRTRLSNYNLIIAGVEGINVYPSGKYGTSDIQRKAVSDIVSETNSVVAFFGNAYALKYFENIHHAKGFILAYQNNKLTQELAAQLIFGAFDAKGKLAVTVDDRFRLNDGLEVSGNNTFSYTIPEEAGMSSALLRKVDTIAITGITEKAYPGCQVLIARNGNIIYHKCFGYLTYSNDEPVETNDVYDWASITKVTGPLPAIMRMVDEKKINIDDKLSKYWPAFTGTNKENLIIREVLAHQARLEAYIAFWTRTVTPTGGLSRDVFHDAPSNDFSVRVSEHLYMNPSYYATMMDTLNRSKLLPRKNYVYSGLSFYLYPKIISNLTGQNFETYLKDTFYRPLGATTVTYNPYLHFPMKQIVPTENDDFFRKENIRGFVHDEGAAMMGGISGNAGLFGTAGDLAKIFQMYLQKGYFGGRRYLTEKTMNEFIRIQYPDNKNRRGLGFDKPLIDNHKNELVDAYPAFSASKNSFGHSGFTGTFAWADPDNGLLFIFMSNRVHPTRENQKLYQLNIRTDMHQTIYNSIIK